MKSPFDTLNIVYGEEGERNDNLRISLDCGRDRICREFEVARTVLVVDDDPLVLEVTADMLKDLGCEVVTAASGMDARAFRKTRTSTF
jgi:hypothetical protein